MVMQNDVLDGFEKLPTKHNTIGLATLQRYGKFRMNCHQKATRYHS